MIISGLAYRHSVFTLKDMQVLRISFTPKCERHAFYTAATLVDLNLLLEAQQGVTVGLMLSSSAVGSVHFITNR